MVIPSVKDILESVFKWIGDHLSFRYFCIPFVLCAVSLFGINRFLAYLDLPPMPPGYRVAAAAGFLLFGSGSLFFAVESGLKKWKEWWKRHKRLVEMRDYLGNLPVDQKKILSEFAHTKKSCLAFQPSNGAVYDLANRGILYRPTNIGDISEGWAFSLTKQALVYFNKPEIQRMLLDSFGDHEEEDEHDGCFGERERQWIKDHPSEKPK